MKTVPLGSAGVEVSAVCLGTLHFGSLVEKEVSYQILDCYVDAGGTFLDTANMYYWKAPAWTGGESETLLGEWMADRDNRDRMFVASKVGFGYEGVERGLSAGQIETECEKSLKRLRTDVIDLYYAHHDDRTVPMEEVIEALDRLVRKGKVRFIGASNFRAWRLAQALEVSRAHGWAEYCCIQQFHTYLRPRRGTRFEPQVVANKDLLDCCSVLNLPLLAYSPFLRGAYAREEYARHERFLCADSDARVAALKAVAAETGATANQVVLTWMLHSDPLVIPIVGASKLEQIRENLGEPDVHLSREQMDRLDNAAA